MQRPRPGLGYGLRVCANGRGMGRHLDAIDAASYRSAMVGGAASVARNRDAINMLNVFPVPDADTGSNMLLTLRAAVDALSETGDGPLCDAAHAAARAAFMAARGCSGVIVSQILSGFADGLDGCASAGPVELARALSAASAKARRALREPLEGTILSVLDAAANAAARSGAPDIAGMLDASLAAAREALARTPEQLPVLARAGVVDAGGFGFVCFLEGVLRALRGEGVDGLPAEPAGATRADAARIRPGVRYCVSLLLEGDDLDPCDIEGALRSADNAEVMVVSEPGLIKLHVHTSAPDRVVALASSLGNPRNLQIDDVEAQWREAFCGGGQASSERLATAIAVAPAEGIAAIFQSLGAVVLCETSPSVEQIAALADRARAVRAILVPATKDAAAAGEKAAVVNPRIAVVVPSRTVPQAAAALVAFMPDADVGSNAAAMGRAASRVRTVVVARATRAARSEDGPVAPGDIVSIAGDSIRRLGPGWPEAVLAAVRDAREDGDEIVSVYRGRTIPARDGAAVAEALSAGLPGMKVTTYYGGQQSPEFIIGIE